MQHFIRKQSDIVLFISMELSSFFFLGKKLKIRKNACKQTARNVKTNTTIRA